MHDDDLIYIAETDSDLPRHWLSGSLKYGRFRPLGEGGMSIIQRCYDKNLKRDVAYKTLRPEYRDSEQANRRFLREARVTAKISHPGTVPLYEIGRDRSGNLYFTMKLLVGRDLDQIFAKLVEECPETTQDFPIPRLIDILIQVGQTVSYAHAHGVIHRDLKPANILIGEFGEVTVLDWGLAKVHGDEGNDVRSSAKMTDAGLTQPGKRYGTPLYMSPEQARGDSGIDEGTDIYNIGSMFYEALTLQPLVKRGEIEDVVAQVLLKRPEKPSRAAPQRDIPTDLDRICLRALAFERKKRFKTLPDLVDSLQAYRLHGSLPAE